ncbi:hypothetical protein NicSoilC12_19640 [Arthrobacter sp. NicSoilC12]|nr:hypothetical protein NicSoilC12_19640 [Arthrobacter sp. NicSoilC12]
MRSLIQIHELKVYAVFLGASLVLCSVYLFVILAKPVEPGSILPSYVIALAAALAMTQILWAPTFSLLKRSETPKILIPAVLTAATVAVALIFGVFELALLHSAAVAILVGIYLSSVALFGGCILMVIETSLSA